MKKDKGWDVDEDGNNIIPEGNLLEEKDRLK